MTRNALFDLDGTLVESGRGIIANVRHAMAAVGHPLDASVDLSWVIGPPLPDIFARLLSTEPPAIADEAGHRYRASYDTVGLFEAAVYPPIPATLAAFAAGGWRLFVATSKPAGVARRVLEHFGLAGHFQAVFGAATDSVLAHKPELIAYLLTTQGLDPAGTVMIGDRRFDISGAHANKLRAIGVLWGYGDRDELERAGADALAEAPDQLPGLADGLL